MSKWSALTKYGLCSSQPRIQSPEYITGWSCHGAYSKNTCKLKLLSEFGRFQCAMRVAATRSGLLAVADYLARGVSIYRKDNSDFKRLCSENVTRPSSVAATSEGKFLIM